jgi:LysR family carnitine catabolism transcriptional activator
MRITLRQIEGFLAAAEELSFSKAARRLNVTQSAFSQSVRETEVALGVRLFDRTTRRVVLTASGAALLQKMRAGVAAIEEACEDARAINRLERRHLALATLPSQAARYVTGALGDLRRAHPGITLTVYEAHNPELMGMVRDERVELAVCARAPCSDELQFEPLYEEEIVAVVPGDHPLAGKSRQAWTRLAGTPLILMVQQSSTRGVIEQALRDNGIDERPAFEVTALATAIAIVRAGLGIAIQPLGALMEPDLQGLGVCRMIDPVATRQIGFYRRADCLPSEAALRVSELIRGRVRMLRRPGITL